MFFIRFDLANRKYDASRVCMGEISPKQEGLDKKTTL
jgi:hypothetical protein